MGSHNTVLEAGSLDYDDAPYPGIFWISEALSGAVLDGASIVCYGVVRFHTHPYIYCNICYRQYENSGSLQTA